MQFWATERRGAVEITTFSNPPHNYLDKPVIDELQHLVEQWRDPSDSGCPDPGARSAGPVR
jgi:enoyl-CoA hydratase/carnithine racemase